MTFVSGERLKLEIVDVQAEARDVVLLELRAQNGGTLPAFDPGAHLEVELPNGLVRHYSLVNDCRERDRYLLGVGRAAQGRGGSEFVHRSLRRGMMLTTSAPRNNFRLDASAASFLFIAGGIGITPIMSMIRWCEAEHRPWKLVYASRNAQRAAFSETLQPLRSRVQFHFDDQRGDVLDVRPLLADVAAGEHVYCCGPQPLMQAVQTHAAHLPAGSVHFEYFTVANDAISDASPGAFTIELKKSGQTLQVPSDKSILEILEANGHSIPFSCREGLCGTCQTSVCAGEPEHHDYVLSIEERAANTSMMVCVSRAISPVLVLDL